MLHYAHEVVIVEIHGLGLIIVGMHQTDELVALLHDQALVDISHRVELVLNLLWIDVLSVASEQHVLYAASDEDMSICRHGAEVARVVPSVGIKNGACGLFVLIVAEHGVHASCQHLTRRVLRVIAVYAHLHVLHGQSA